MKIVYAIPAAWITIAIIFLARMDHHPTTNGINISIKDSPKWYILKAQYDPQNTSKVTHYIDSILQPRPVILNNQELKETIIMEDGTTFLLKAAVGKLTIEVDKRKNSAESLKKIKTLCDSTRALMFP